MSAQPQGQPGQPGAAQGQQIRVPMYRPEHMRNLEILSDADKEKYERGLRGLWDAMENNPPDSAAHKQAKTKIADFSRMVFGKVANMRRAAQQGQGGPGQQPLAAGQQTANAGNAAALAAQRANMAAQARPNPAINGGAAAATTPGGQPRPAMTNLPQVSQAVLQMVNNLRVGLPADIANDAEKAAKYRQDVKTKYMKALTLMEQNQKKILNMQAHVKDRTSKGLQFTPEEQARLNTDMESARKTYAEGKRFADSIKQQASQGLQDGVGTPGAQSASQPARAPPAATPGNPMQAATASVNAAMDAAKNLQSAGINRQPGAAQTPTTSGAPSLPVQTTAPSSQPQVATAPQTQVKIEPGSQPHPPPVNTALAAAANTAVSAGTPTQNTARVQTPQTATPTTAGPAGAARPLSHAGAMALANKHSSHNVPTLSQQGNAGAPTTNTPGSAGIQNTPQAGHTHAHPQHPGAQHPAGAVPVPKMPIPKHLPERAQAIPQPVAVGGGVNPGRPTLGNGLGTAGGTMNQPVINKKPEFNYEAEGEHVLNKKKLDELVRQVCGGGPPGQDGNYLTPDVEESVMQVADHFVDNILVQACRLAKERGSKVLEIRDMQLVLERVYNIRVPGFTSDELRTVRKPQPNGAWLSKVSAVQAAKVTKDEK